MEDISKFLKKNNIAYNDLNLYIEATTHSSFANEFNNEFKSDSKNKNSKNNNSEIDTHTNFSKNSQKNSKKNSIKNSQKNSINTKLIISKPNKINSNIIKDNQRLEFLGDSILGLVINQNLFERKNNLSEGEMAQLKSKIVSEETLARVASKINLGKYIRLGRGEKKFSGEKKSSIISDALEALIAAIYIDQGFAFVSNKIISWFKEELTKLSSPNKSKDSKSSLQEFTQKNFKTLPIYEEINESGPAHHKNYTVRVLINNKEFAQGKGFSIKSAHQKAASRALNLLKKSKQKYINNEIIF